MTRGETWLLLLAFHIRKSADTCTDTDFPDPSAYDNESLATSPWPFCTTSTCGLVSIWVEDTPTSPRLFCYEPSVELPGWSEGFGFIYSRNKNQDISQLGTALCFNKDAGFLPACGAWSCEQINTTKNVVRRNRIKSEKCWHKRSCVMGKCLDLVKECTVWM